MTPTWHATVAVSTTAAPFSEDLPFDVMDTLDAYGAAMSVTRDMTAGTVTITLDAPDVADAATKATDLVSDAVTAHHAGALVTGVSVQSEDDFQAELDAPAFPEVVGYAEIAKLAGVTRQRARQYAQSAGFPEPVIVTAQGPLMSKAAVRQWLDHRSTRRRVPAR